MKMFFRTMAFDMWTLLYLALHLLVSIVGNVEAQSCGGTYTTNYGVFMSPNYPNVYTLNSSCYYTISLPSISSITLTFETFELDRSSGDYVTIRCTSNSSYHQKMYNWNWNIPPISILWCKSGQLFFYSDSSHKYNTRGFRVQYQVNTIGCGNTVFTAPSGIISSPNYPQNYNNNENCTYSIWAQNPSLFTLSFEAFNLETNCQHDWIQIRCDNTSYILPKYCGSTIPKPAYIENCNKVLIWFHTDDSVVSSGFRLQYSVTPNGCGKSNYAGLSGVITSPNYPQKYSGKSCTYYIYPVSSLALAFESFDLEPFIDSINGDYVQIECYSDQNYDYLRYRGDSLPPLVSYTPCRCVRLYFYVNNAVTGTGFKVQYQVNPLVSFSSITNKPINTAAYVGTRVQLNCTSNATGYFPSWTLSRDGTDENTTVIASFCVVNSQYRSKYYVVTGGHGACNLVIRYATLAHAGVYTCIDVSLAAFSSIVSVIEVVSTMRKQPEIVKGDILTFQYSVKFNGSVAPAPILPMIYYWNSTGKSVVTSNITLPNSNSTGKSVATSNITLPNSIISSINVTAEPEKVPSVAFVVTFSAPVIRNSYATNAPAYIYSSLLTAYAVFYWPEESNMTISGDNNGYMNYNESLQCSVSSNPPSSYRWLDDSSDIYTNGSNVSVSHSGTYTCNASNVIRGKTYWSSKSVTVYMYILSDSSDAEVTVIVLAVFLAISVLGYIGFAIFRIARRFQAKPSHEDQRNITESIPNTISGNDYTTNSTVRPTYENPPNQVLLSEFLMTTDNNNHCQYEYLNRAFEHPPAYESLSRQNPPAYESLSRQNFLLH